MRLSQRVGESYEVSKLLDPMTWPERVPAVLRAKKKADSELVDVWLRWPIGVVRRVTVEQGTKDGKAVRVDIVESDWLAGLILYIPETRILTVDLKLTAGAPGTFIAELTRQLQSALAVVSEDAFL